MPCYFSPRMVAEGMVQAVREERLTSPGEWVRFASLLSDLPLRLQVWVKKEILPEVGEDGLTYLETWSTRPPREPAPTFKRACEVAT